MRASLVFALAMFAIACGPSSVRAQAPVIPPAFASSGTPAFDQWRSDFARRAIERGRDRAIVERLLSGLIPDERIIELDQRQPEFVSPVWDYVTNRVTENRITAGLALKAEIGATLARVEEQYGVDGDVVLGVWGLETNYGEAALNYQAAAALATLAYEGRRRAQFETYLMALIEMVERGLASQSQLRSSWAGALGQPQFMPDVYLTTAADGDGDGVRDIWSSRADVAASIANYLQDRGWRRGEPVFDEVTLSEGFDLALANGEARSVADWIARGVRRADGSEFPADDRNLQSQMFLPAGAQGPALLLHPNFLVIRRYNPSDRYALVVALLARAFEGRGGLIRAWPTHIGSLNREQTLELQTLLNGLGYDAGSADGLFGSNTRRAVRAWGLEILCADLREYSNTLTAVLLPAGHDADKVRQIILERFDMSLGAGLGKMQGKIFRIGHLGDFNDLTLAGTLCGVEMGLQLAGVPIRKEGVAAALDYLSIQGGQGAVSQVRVRLA